MAYVRNDSRIKLIPEGHVLHVPVLCHGVFLHAMRVRCGYWRGRMVAAWRELSPDSRVQQYHRSCSHAISVWLAGEESRSKRQDRGGLPPSVSEVPSQSCLVPGTLALAVGWALWGGRRFLSVKPT